MDKLTALKVVQRLEDVAELYGGYDDHTKSVVSAAFGDLARSLAEVLDVPACSCRWYHDDGTSDCPRSAIESEARA